MKEKIGKLRVFFNTLLGHDLGALKVTKWEKRSEVMTHIAEAREKFLVLCRPHGLRPKGENHSYIAAAIAVMNSDAKIAIQSWAEKGTRNAARGTSSEYLEKERHETPE